MCVAFDVSVTSLTLLSNCISTDSWSRIQERRRSSSDLRCQLYSWPRNWCAMKHASSVNGENYCRIPRAILMDIFSKVQVFTSQCESGRTLLRTSITFPPGTDPRRQCFSAYVMAASYCHKQVLTWSSVLLLKCYITDAASQIWARSWAATRIFMCGVQNRKNCTPHFFKCGVQPSKYQ